MITVAFLIDVVLKGILEEIGSCKSTCDPRSTLHAKSAVEGSWSRVLSCLFVARSGGSATFVACLESKKTSQAFYTTHLS